MSMLAWAVVVGMIAGTIVACTLVGGARHLRQLDEEGAILRTRPPADTRRNIAS